jgi:hypothetical protein
VRYSIGFAFVVALGVMGSAMGCGEDDNDCGARCLGDRANLRVNLDPAIFGTYDVDLVLDGARGSFTCGGTDYSRTGPTNQTGIAQTVVECWGPEFWIKATPEAVEISVTAQDGSWTGSAKESPDYVRVTRCPGGSELCPPFAVVVVEQQ